MDDVIKKEPKDCFSKKHNKVISDENSNKLNHKREYIFETILKKSNFQIDILDKSILKKNNNVITNQKLRKKNKNTKNEKETIKKYFKMNKNKKSKIQKSFLNMVSHVKGESKHDKFSIPNSKSGDKNKKDSNISENEFVFKKEKLLEAIQSIENLHNGYKEELENHSEDELSRKYSQNYYLGKKNI